MGNIYTLLLLPPSRRTTLRTSHASDDGVLDSECRDLHGHEVGSEESKQAACEAGAGNRCEAIAIPVIKKFQLNVGTLNMQAKQYYCALISMHRGQRL